MPVSVITTLKNEEKTLGPFLNGLLAQSRKPDEIVVVDGGSTDRSLEIIEQFVSRGEPIKAIVAPGNRAVGRNAAITGSKYDIIASSDFGSIPDADWLDCIVEPLEGNPDIDVVSGVTLPNASSLFEHCVAVTNLPEVAEIDQENFLPSSRSMAFRKTAWEKAGGYPEQFSWNEDTLFDFALKRAGARFEFAPNAIVYWRPPGSFARLFRQFFFYARGDGQAGIYLMEFYAPRKYAVYGLGVALLSLSMRWPWFFISLVLGVGIYLFGLTRKAFRRTGKWRALVLMPAVMLTRDFAEMLGYLVGWADRWHDPSRFRRSGRQC
jgi:glycosyltransferase involved in cell wall biosynthesis